MLNFIDQVHRILKLILKADPNHHGEAQVGLAIY